jgi:hypothetical protein
MSIDSKRLTAAIGRRLRTITVRLGRSVTVYRGRHEVSTGKDDSPRGANGMNKTDASANSTTSSQAWLPIGPSCC